MFDWSPTRLSAASFLEVQPPPNKHYASLKQTASVVNSSGEINCLQSDETDLPNNCNPRSFNPNFLGSSEDGRLWREIPSILGKINFLKADMQPFNPNTPTNAWVKLLAQMFLVYQLRLFLKISFPQRLDHTVFFSRAPRTRRRVGNEIEKIKNFSLRQLTRKTPSCPEWNPIYLLCAIFLGRYRCPAHINLPSATPSNTHQPSDMPPR